MASQDLISQYSSDLNAIPPSQPDRSRTPPRHQHGWHQTVPMFRGPMHYAMATHRPFWNPSGIPPPPPTSTSFPTHPPWTPSTAPFPPTPPTFSQPPPNNANFVPQRHPFTPRSPATYVHLREYALLSMKDIPVGRLRSHRLTNGNPMSTSTTPTRSMAWTSPPESDKAVFPATKTLKVWIPYKSHSGSSCTRAYTTPGSAVLHTDEKPSSFLLTT